MNVKRVKRPKRIATVTAAITTAAIVAAGAAPAFAQPTQEALTSGLPAAEAKSTNGRATTIPEAEKQVAEATAAADAARAVLLVL